MMDTCRKCRFWHDDSERDGIAPCRRFPVPIPKESADWCGEWKPRAVASGGGGNTPVAMMPERRLKVVGG